MKNFFRTVLATIVGLIIFNILLFLLFLISIGIISTAVSFGKRIQPVQSNSILHLTLDYPIEDRVQDTPLSQFEFTGTKLEQKFGLNEILKMIEKAKNDEKITGIYLEVDNLQSNMANIEEIRNSLLDFKESGKFIISSSSTYMQPSYYLATAADSIYMNPSGLLTFVGLSSQVLFFKKAMEKLGIEAEIFRHGQYKSAVEPFMYKELSEDNERQLTVLLGTIWKHMLNGIGKQRNIPIDNLQSLAENLTINTPGVALQNNLVDGLLYQDQVFEILKSLSGITEKKQSPRLVTLDKYYLLEGAGRKPVTENKLAVIYAQGPIVLGEGNFDEIGAKKMARTIRQARKDSTVKAIVFRVNSGGGSAIASEVIWRELLLAQKEKPVIASLGGVAASGGYYIVTPADTIVSETSTITGSIGVFGILINASQFLEEKIGITSDMVKTAKHADLGNVFRPVSEFEAKIIQQSIDTIYWQFVTRVAEGRNMDTGKVNEIAGGRIWSGADAEEIGLVDLIGGLDESIKIAASKAGLEEYSIINLPRYENIISRLLRDISSDMKTRTLKNELGENYIYYRTLKSLIKSHGIQMRMDYDISIE